MFHTHLIGSGRCEPILKLQMATGIGCGNDFGASSVHVAELALEQAGRRIRLRDIVDASGAATPSGFRALAQLHPWHRLENRPWLRAHFLSMAQMAAFMVSHRASGRIQSRLTKVNLNEKFVDVAQLSTPLLSARVIEMVVVKQVIVGAQMRAAASCIADDRVKVEGIDQIKLTPRERARGFDVSIMGM